MPSLGSGGLHYYAVFQIFDCHITCLRVKVTEVDDETSSTKSVVFCEAITCTKHCPEITRYGWAILESTIVAFLIAKL